MKYFLILLSTGFYLLSTPLQAHATSEFKTSFTSAYTISRTATTKVVHTIVLKNNLAHIYATSYTIAVSGEELSELSTSDERGPIEHSKTSQNGVTNIHLKIDHPSIGKNQEKKLVISYQTGNVVEKIGDTLTINIPRLAKANEADSYTRTVSIEGVQDMPGLISPSASLIEPVGNFMTYTWNGYGNDSLTLLFGDSVTYHLNLTYELKNKELKPGQSELALPPDTGYQKILLANLSPEPTSIHLDNSGNWLARYNLKAQEKLIVNADIFATIYPRPVSHDPSVKTLQMTPRSQYWDMDSASLQSLAQRLKTPLNIYKYLTENFVYNYAGVTGTSNRQGATQAITLENAVLCTEFTDAFVALSRLNHIPSREINGYGYTKNSDLQPQSTTSDILHAWPEYFDETSNKWVSIDPTWGNTTGGVDYFTKLDFSHITFVRHGDEDSYPLPAGAYKSEPDDLHIKVEVAEEVPKTDSHTQKVGNMIYNRGNVAVINDTVGYLPPYGSFTLRDTASPGRSLYDKIKALCASLLSKFWPRPPAST